MENTIDSAPQIFSPTLSGTPDRTAWTQSKERYEQQVLYVLAVLRRYPEYIDVLDKEDKEQFLRYFKPDWTQVGTFVKYHDQMMDEQPDIESSSSWLLAKFCTLNQLVPPTIFSFQLADR